jgi:hypothetical protein
MASSKKRRKQANQARKAKAGPGRGIHPDGDRRRRKEMTAAVAAAAKRRAMEQLPGVILPDDVTGLLRVADATPLAGGKKIPEAGQSQGG